MIRLEMNLSRAFLILVVYICSIRADEGNLNFASITWRKDTTIGPYGVTFTVKSIWNRKYENIIYCGGKLYQPSVDISSCITSITLLGSQDGTPRFKFLDTNRTEYPLSLTVSNLSTAADPRNWVAGYFQMSNNYTGPGPWQVEFSGCCLAKSPQQPFLLAATVHLIDADASPSIAVLPTVSVPSGQRVWIPALSLARAPTAALSWALVRKVASSGSLDDVSLAPTTGLLSVPAGVAGAGYLTVRVSSGGASSPALFALECGGPDNYTLAPLAASPVPEPQRLVFQSGAPHNLAYTFYTGFAFQARCPRPTAAPVGSAPVPRLFWSLRADPIRLGQPRRAPPAHLS
jgi:hypothetical protein